MKNLNKKQNNRANVQYEVFLIFYITQKGILTRRESAKVI